MISSIEPHSAGYSNTRPAHSLTAMLFFKSVLQLKHIQHTVLSTSHGEGLLNLLEPAF